jgi:hypothetical protein
VRFLQWLDAWTDKWIYSARDLRAAEPDEAPDWSVGLADGYVGALEMVLYA